MPISSQSSSTCGSHALWLVRSAFTPMSFMIESCLFITLRLNAMPSGPMSACRSTPYSCTRRPFRWKPSSAVNSAVRTPKRTDLTSTASPARTPISAVYRFGLSTSHSFGFFTSTFNAKSSAPPERNFRESIRAVPTTSPAASRTRTPASTLAADARRFVATNATRTSAASFLMDGVVTNSVPGATCTGSVATSRTAR